MSEQTQNEIEYIEPTQEHIGQIVEVRDVDHVGWTEATLTGLLQDDFRFAAKCSRDKYSIGWRFARIPRPKPQPTPAPVSSISEETQPKDTHDTPKSIDWTKPVRTKDGRAVRVLCTDGPGDYPVAGYIEGEMNPRSWSLNGQIHKRTPHSQYDLENVPQRIQREYWVNVYATCLGSHHDTKEDADYHATGQRLACVKITIDCEEGEGL